MTEQTSSRFPEEALQALEFPEVLEWIAGLTQTAAGRRVVTALRPGAAVPVVAARRGRGREALAAVMEAEEPSVARAGDLAPAVESGSKRPLSGFELVGVAEGLECALGLRRWSADHADHRALAETIASIPVHDELLAEIRRILDPQGRVKDEADKELARVRQSIIKLTAERKSVIERAAEAWGRRGALRQIKPLLRNGRSVLAVKKGHRGRVNGVLHDQSQSGDTLYMEPAEVLAVSNRLADMEQKEERRVRHLLGELGRLVARERAGLEAALLAMAEIDAAFAAARWCKGIDGVYPEWDGDQGVSKDAHTPGHLVLRDAVHPLLLRKSGREGVVPLSLTMGEEWDLLVVTGPNTGGKTVALKTVGLLGLLAQAGLPLPATEGTRMPVLKGVDADIGDPQSLASSLSTFSGHMHRLLRILENAGPGSLVLIDELGTGTDPEEGAALGRAVLEELLRRGAMVLASTHIGALKLFSLEVPRAENASMEFDPESLAPLYRLLVGVPGASHALEVAESLGLPGAVLERARSLTRRDGEEHLLAKVGQLRRDAEQIRERARDSEAAARDARRRIESEEESARRIRDLREREAERAFQELSTDLHALINGAGDRLLARLHGTDREMADRLLKEARERLENNQLGQRWEGFLGSLKKGDVVYVPRFQERLKILKVDQRRNRVKVRRGALEIEVPMREITWVTPPPGKNPV